MLRCIVFDLTPIYPYMTRFYQTRFVTWLLGVHLKLRRLYFIILLVIYQIFIQTDWMPRRKYEKKMCDRFIGNDVRIGHRQPFIGGFPG